MRAALAPSRHRVTFRTAPRELPPHLASTPRIVNVTVPGELAVDR